ncbi:putative pumilio-repeat RNA-binding protein [Leptomonas pyrrhocoris]|uniref:Putative pumilio-repeat RNA-binding protein n=1 Tax=Leptomonas pyrrhocoris TaxID=157538 RepID=A0A0N0DT63_LEPPY|nr:putative pumilio-repeat RNA-binding protein [Leptomonas pyrrhocoris]KPA76961.1 putative pumilio-repeat RNA-binding protein [Leptomonas pyrrhocoris]|eukprot:XP_015655400.1 putative pumilio-repeat RNA-binding protein [Leptomonas pyrrhocoris]
MGKRSEFTRSRFKELRHKREERVQRSRDVRDRRHGIDKSKRMIDKVIVQRPLPSAAQTSLLLRQFAQASRLAAPSTDLCLLMRHYATMAEEAGTKTATSKEGEGRDDGEAKSTSSSAKVASRKRGRESEAGDDTDSLSQGIVFLDSLADALLMTESTPAVLDEAAAEGNVGEDDEDAAAEAAMEEEDPLTLLQDILQDDSGRRVVSTLLASLSAVHSTKCEAVATAVLEQFEENEHLPQHHVACRVMSALVQYGSDATRQRVLDLLRQRGTTTEAVVQLLSDRHTAGTIERLLEHHRALTASWLCEVLSLTATSSSPKKTQTKSAAKKAAEAGEDDTDGVSTEKLMELIIGAVSGQVLLQLVQTGARRELLRRLTVSDLLQTKRGTTFLTQMLTLTAPPSTENGSEAEAEAVVLFDDLLERLGSDLGLMAVDKRANFVVQALVQLLPAMGSQSLKQLECLQRALGGAAGISALAAHGNGVHVVLSLIDTAFQLPAESAVEEVAEQLITRQTVKEMLHHHHGSLVVRRLMPLISRKTSKVGRLLQGMVEQDMSNLVYTEAGNLVVQAYLKALGKAGASLLAQKLANNSEELVSMCCSPYASHVVFTLFELVDPATHTSLCNTLKPHVLRLSTHVNGRFIVEKMIAASRDIRSDVSSQFIALAQERGTQHLLCVLLASLDPRGKKHVVEKLIMPNFSALATHQCGSIALQKLMQAEPDLLAAVRARLSSNSLVRSDLAQNFFGKFVVQIAQQPQQQKAAEATREEE